MALHLITGPSVEPLTVAEARAHLRLDDSAGEPSPVAVTAALASPAVAGNLSAGAYRYLATFVTADGETEAGAISGIVTIANPAVNGKVELTAIPTGGAAVTSRKVYRTEAAGSTYLLLATIANNTASTYTDNIADASLGAQAPTTNTTVDPYVTNLIVAARERAEVATRRQLLRATWDLYLDAWPRDGVIEIPKPPLDSVTYVKYTDTGGTLTTLALTTDWLVSAPAGPRCRRGRVTLAYGQSWPSIREIADAIVVRFVAGYGATASTVPKLLRQAMLIDMGTLHEHREDVVVGTITAELPRLSAYIYRSYRSHARHGTIQEAA